MKCYYIKVLQISGTGIYNEKCCKLVVKVLQISAGGKNIFCYLGPIIKGSFMALKRIK